MGSRRSMGRSFSGNGGNGGNGVGDEACGSRRPGGCSYLSNVRPENRSTFCSVMAHLAEETQPSFETTLKSRAVSENSTVKFTCVVTGHPTPLVTWYKDDAQLDRYCGLPKYEIFRNGQNHSLHIYNCTVDDAAIYQASAANTKGIVSCSGVLEVGEMNEFKIHQRYFDKLKQKAEKKRREAEGKENQEPLRTISPDRTQRKRRSTMDTFLSTPSSPEDEGNQENHQDAVETNARLQETKARLQETNTRLQETKARLQETAMEKVEEKPVSIANGTSSPVTNGQDVGDVGGKSGTYVYDSAQKTFTALQPTTPFVNKKIRISNGAKVSPEERRATVAGDESAPSKEEFMEVESVVTTSALNSGSSRNLMDRNQRSVRSERPSKDRSVRVDVPAAAAAVVVPPVRDRKRPQTETQRKDAEEPVELDGTSTQPQSHVPSTPVPPLHIVEADVTMTVDATVADVKGQRGASTGVAPRTPLDVTCKSGAVGPGRPREATGDQLCDTGTERGGVRVREVTQARAEMSRNDAPVDPELPAHQNATAAPPTETQTKAHDRPTPSLYCGLQKDADKMTRDTRDQSRGSTQSHERLFTDRQKSPVKSPNGGKIPGGGKSLGNGKSPVIGKIPTTSKSLGDGKSPVASKSPVSSKSPIASKSPTSDKSPRGRNMSPSAQGGPFNADIKTVEGNEKVERKKAGQISVQSDGLASHEKKMKMETEVSAGEEKTRVGDERDTHVLNAHISKEGTEKTPPARKGEEKTRSEPENPPSIETTMPQLVKDQENPDSSEPQMKNHKEPLSPEAKVVSIAELLRSQLKALANSITMLPPTTEQQLYPTNADMMRGSGNTGRKCTSVPDNQGSVETPPASIKATLLEIYNLLNKTDQELMLQDATVSSDQASHKPPGAPPGSDIDSSSTAQTCSAARTEEAMTRGITPGPDVSELQTPVEVKDQEDVAPGSKILQNGPVQGQDTKRTVQPTPEIKVNSESLPGEVKPSPVSEPETTRCLQTEQRLAPEPVHDPDSQTLTQQETCMTVDCSSPASLTLTTPDVSPRLKRRTCVSPLPSATPQELASGARRKILPSKPKQEEEKDNVTQTKISPGPVTLQTSPSLPRHSTLLQPSGERTPPAERRSPLQSRRKTIPEPPQLQRTEEVPKAEVKPAEKDKHDPFKAPQVIRRIRAETFADSSGHLKLWCQFFNVLTESTIKWFRNEVEIAQTKRSAGDEAPVNLAIVQASAQDSGVYGCTITNQYGTDATDFLLSTEILTGMSLREDLGVGEEIEMTPLIFNKGVADTCVWTNKLFGRVVVQESGIGAGRRHKVWKAKVIYGLEPVFESGNTCIIKAPNPVVYAGKGETGLIEKNLEEVKQECKTQNLAREYCKIFSAEARALEHFGATLEMIPVYLVYRPANAVPYATVEAYLTGEFHRYSVLDPPGCAQTGTGTGSEMEEKCSTFQHWIFQWSNGNLLFTQMEGVDNKITNVRVSVKSTGHQGLPLEGNPRVFEQFVARHQCNYYCGLLGLKSLRVLESLLTPAKPKASKSPLLQRKMTPGSSSPQPARKASGSPKVTRKAEQDGSKSPTK